MAETAREEGRYELASLICVETGFAMLEPEALTPATVMAADQLTPAVR